MTARGHHSLTSSWHGSPDRQKDGSNRYQDRLGNALMSNAVTMTEGEEENTGKSLVNRKLILLSVPLLLGVIICGLWLSGVLPTRFSTGSRTQMDVVAEKPSLIDVPDIVTNLDSGNRRAVFIKLKARVEISHKADQLLISANMPRILDAFHTYLRSMRPEELRGGEGTYRLREALMSRIDAIAAPVQVTDVLFVEMLIQ